MDRSFPSGRSARALFVAAVLLCMLPTTPSFAQSEPPEILVIRPLNRTNDASMDRIAVTVEDTIELTLGLLGNYNVREVEESRITSQMRAGNRQALSDFAEDNGLDFVVFGEVRSAQGGIEIIARVLSRGSRTVSVEEARTAESVLDTFDVTDELTAAFLSSFSGRQIVFGTIRIQRQGWNEGEYTVFVDGVEAGSNIAAANNVLVGERYLEIRADNGPSAGSIIFGAPILVRDNRTNMVSFVMERPAPAVVQVPAQEEEPEQPSEPEPKPESEPEPDPEPEPEPMAREPRPNPADSTWLLGVRGGLGSSSALGDLYDNAVFEDTWSELGWYLGITLDLKLVGPLWLETGLGVAHKAHGFYFLTDSIDADFTETVTYLQFPLLAKLRFLGNVGNGVVGLGLAPDIAIATGGEFEDYARGTTEDLTDEYYEDYLNDFNFSLYGTAGYEFVLGPKLLLGLEFVVDYHLLNDFDWGVEEESRFILVAGGTYVRGYF